MLILRIKRCQSALAGGRLDEAAELLSGGNLRAHRQGQYLTDKLVAALIDRGQAHLAAGRMEAAARDCEKAAPLAGNSAKLAELRSAVVQAMEQNRKRDRQRDRAAGAVRHLAEQGHFSLAKEVAVRAVADGAVAGTTIVDGLEQRQAHYAQCLAGASDAIDRQDWDSAMRHIAGARTLGAGRKVDALVTSVGDKIAASAAAAIDSGRLDAVESLLRPVAGECQNHLQLRQIETALGQFRSGWTLVRCGKYVEAHEVLARLQAQWPRAEWLKGAVAGLSRAGESLTAVRCGPLGLIDMDQTLPMAAKTPRGRTSMSPGAFQPIVPPPATDRARSPSSLRGERLLLHVDGSGSYVVIPSDSIDIGPISASRPSDVPLMTLPSAPLVTLCRSDEDYFLNSRAPVPVNQRMVSSTLLSDGDEIGIGPRCRIEFRRPNAASASAILRISGARLPWSGVREVILMDRELVIGAASSAHIRAGSERDSLTIQSRNGRLVCRSDRPIAVDGTPTGTTANVGVGNRIESGTLSFVIQQG